MNIINIKYLLYKIFNTFQFLYEFIQIKSLNKSYVIT